MATLDAPNAKVNSLGAEVQAEFEKILQDIETNPAITAAVITSAKPGNSLFLIKYLHFIRIESSLVFANKNIQLYRPHHSEFVYLLQNI